MLERIGAMHDPRARLEALRTLILSELVLPSSPHADCSCDGLLGWLNLASASSVAARNRLATAEAGRMTRLSIDDLVRALTFLVFRELIPELSMDKLECQFHRPWMKLSPVQQEIVHAFLYLLAATSHWMLGFYGRISLRDALQELPAGERDEFFMQSAELAQLFHHTFGANPSSAESMAAARGAMKC